jgi:Ca2+-binding RTX toxin-like protein
MAVVNGTAAADLIHRAGDGQSSGSLNEVIGVTTGADSISAGAGADLAFGDAGNDTINGEDGFDTLVGGQGSDRMFGGVGNDVFMIQQVSDVSGISETFNGGNDIDVIDFASLSAFGTADLTQATIVSVETLLLSNNIVTLTSAQLGGFTSISGSGFPDTLILADGGLVDLTGAAIASIDEIRGNGLANQLVLTGVTNGQVVNTLDGADSVAGSNGNDSVDGGAAADSLAGSNGNDTLRGGDDDDTVEGGQGNDLIYGGTGADSLTGTAGNDVFRVTLVGEISGLAETISGGADIDTLDFQTEAASGDADISAAVISGIETLALGATTLTLRATQLGAFTSVLGTGFTERVILSGAGTADLTGATITGIDEFRGSAGADGILLTGVALGQFIDGLAGNDTLSGTQAADLIEGGLGNDVITGNEGSDTLRGEQGTDNLSGGIGNDSFQFAGISDISNLAETIDGGNDSDTMDFSALGATGRINLSAATIQNVEALRIADNVVTLTTAQLGNFETIQGSGFFERIQITTAGVVDLTGSNIAGIDEFTGTSGADTFLFAGGTGNLVVNTLGGADSVQAGDSNDTLLGGAGNDTLNGGLGADVITGGQGTDSMTGGLGTDLFSFTDLTDLGSGGARDVITDFTHGIDVISLTALDANLNVPGDQAFSFVGSAAFTNTAGELRYAGGNLSADVDGDGITDFQIALTGSPTLTAADFLL